MSPVAHTCGTDEETIKASPPTLPKLRTRKMGSGATGKKTTQEPDAARHTGNGHPACKLHRRDEPFQNEWEKYRLKAPKAK